MRVLGKCLLVLLVSTPWAGGLSALTFDTPLDLGGETFSVAVAKDEESLRKGLMGVTRLAPHQGMLFLFDKERVATFWMKDTPLALDLAFFTKDGRIVMMGELTPLARTSVSSPTKVVGALELPRGTFARIGATLGSKITSPALLS
ncbi:MAG: hypothetical protein C0514_03605 [Candidatus Puniceispirillum sp.]|nr:hypothetical protein [Candidatus Puniceispirillum sp.]